MEFYGIHITTTIKEPKTISTIFFDLIMKLFTLHFKPIMIFRFWHFLEANRQWSHTTCMVVTIQHPITFSSLIWI